MALVSKKAEKAEVILCKMENTDNEEEFKRLFIEAFPNDWKKICDKYTKEEKADKKAMGIRCPNQPHISIICIK